MFFPYFLEPMVNASGAISLHTTDTFQSRHALPCPRNLAGKPKNSSDERRSYAKLLHATLEGAPEKCMSLHDIYDHFEHHHKAKINKRKRRSWQNSICHALSTNDVSMHLLAYT
jgi:hypothetical protein